MFVVDANVLIYAVDSNSAHHESSRRWLRDVLGGREAVGFAWAALVAFLRVSTHPGIFDAPLSIEAAGAQLERWLGEPAAVVVEPTTRHPAVLRGLLLGAGRGGNLVNDAHLAALAIEHGAEIVSYDRDFGRFPGVKHRLPAAP